MSGRVGGLLARGMVAGLVAGLLASAVASILGEPSIERAIAYESAAVQASSPMEEPELVSRAFQAREGLLAASALYGTAIGGLFGLGFALAYGRLGRLGPKATTAALAVAGFVAIALLPALKYPANPPAVGSPETIGTRTALYFALLLVSVGAMALAAVASRPLRSRFGAVRGNLGALALLVTLVVIAALALPAPEQVPEDFPADVVAGFRLASLATQATLWAALGLGFALVLPQRHERRPGGPSRPMRRHDHIERDF